MSLPRLPKDTIPYKNKWVKKATLRPFTVGEQKILLQYKDATTPKEIFQALHKLMSVCVSGVDVVDLPIFVVEDMFLKIRSKSIGESIDLSYICKADVEGNECGGKMKFSLDLTQFKIVEPEGYTNKIMLSDTIGIVMKELPMSFYMESGDELSDDDLMISCIESIFDGDDVTMASDVSREELQAFYDDILPQVKIKIEQAFVEKKPHIYYHKELKCPKCGQVHQLEFDNIADVFL